MENKDSPNSSNISHIIFMYVALVVFGVTILYYFDKIIGSIIIVSPIAYSLIKKFPNFIPLEVYIKKLFFSTKRIMFLGVFLIIIAIAIYAYKQIDFSSNHKIIKPNTLSGIVWDEQNEPLNGVIIFLPELNILDTTDITGKFSLIVSDTTLITVTIVAQKEGFKTYEAEGSIGNPNYNFIMIKK